MKNAHDMKNMPVVSVIVLTYNSEAHLPALFASLAQQTYQAIELIVIDNASHDSTLQWLDQQTICSIQTCIRNPENVWYAKANNQAASRATGTYILFCNDDLVLEPDCIEKLVTVAEQHSRAGVIGAKLLKLTSAGGIPIVDSAGLIMTRWRQVRNRGENQPDTDQFTSTAPTPAGQAIFGITGALLMASRTALDSVSTAGEYFDPQFVAYKEDVDISWRMLRAGFENLYVPTAVAYHARSIQQGNLLERTAKPSLIRAMSYRNHWWTIIKNDTAKEFWRDAWLILPYELMKFLYILVAEWGTVRILPELWRGIKTMRAKRQSIANTYSLQKWIQ